MLAPPACRPIRVVIADDHEVVRAGIGRLLEVEDDIEVVGLARDGEEAIALSADREPDVVLMDLQMPRVDGIEATQAISRTRDGPSVVVLTSFSDRRRITAAIDSGAVGYLLKDSEPDELLAGIRAAAGGACPLAPRVAMALVEERRNGGSAGDAAARAEGMSDREREVLALVGAGVANKQIAYRLGISPKTVKSHLSHIFRHIGVRDRLQAALWARRHGFVDETDGSRIRS
jgi:DNA-binding NarL/FixJ family response regulator